jgi:hypothetical protein
MAKIFCQVGSAHNRATYAWQCSISTKLSKPKEKKIKIKNGPLIEAIKA